MLGYQSSTDYGKKSIATSLRRSQRHALRLERLPLQAGAYTSAAQLGAWEIGFVSLLRDAVFGLL